MKSSQKSVFLEEEPHRETMHRYADFDLTVHQFVPDRPHYPHPQWATDLGIPEHCNRGIFTVVCTPEIGKRILLESNHKNRPLNDKRIRPIRLALQNDTYRDDSPDSFVVDWRWMTVNAQKRISAAVEANLPIKMRMEYGVDPALRPYIDASEWRKYHDRWQWTENRQDNQIINQMLTLYFKLYSGLGSGSYAYDDALAIWEKCGASMRWMAQLVRRYELRTFKDASKSPSTVSSYLALAELYRRNKEKAINFANELYVIDDALPKNQQGEAYRRWLSGGGRAIVDQKELYLRAVYFMRRALVDEQVRYGVDHRITGVSGKRGEVDAQVRKPEPKRTTWSDAFEENKTALLTVGKDDVAKELRRKHGIVNADSVLSAASVLHREGIGAQELKGIVEKDAERWCVASRFGKKLYKMIVETSNKHFSTASCVAFMFEHVDVSDLAAVEPFFQRITRRDFLRRILAATERGRLTYGFDSRLGKLLAYQGMVDVECKGEQLAEAV